MVKLKEQNINNRHTDFLPKLTFYIFAEEKLHSAKYSSKIDILHSICIFFAEDEYPIYQQQKNIHTIYRQINNYTIYQQIKKKLL